MLALAEYRDFLGLPVRMLTLIGMTITKKAAGRPKDLLALLEIELMREAEERRKKAGLDLDGDAEPE